MTATLTNSTVLETLKDDAAKIGSAIARFETAIGNRAKDYGMSFLVLVHSEGFASDAIIGDTKKALGWTKLTGETGAKIKNRFNVWFTNLRNVNEAWGDFDDATKAELLTGKRSFLTVAKSMADTAKADKVKAELAVKADDAAKAGDTLGADTPLPGTPAPTVADKLAAFQAYVEGLSSADVAANGTAFAAIVAAISKAAATAIATDGKIAVNG